MVSFANLSRAQKGGVRYSRRRRNKSSGERLEGEIHTRADHSKIIVWAVHKIPAEITDPTDVRG
jgi:hypothetical protein